MKKIFIKRYGFLFTCFISYAIATSAQTSDLRLVDWSPKSQLVVKETKIIKPKYPVIDIHNHLRDLSKAEYYLKEMDKAGVWMCANLDGLSENDLYKENCITLSREKGFSFSFLLILVGLMRPVLAKRKLKDWKRPCEWGLGDYKFIRHWG